MVEIKLNVDGMVCGGCEKRVINVLAQIDGVNQVVANHLEGIVVINANKQIDINIIKEMIEELGFEVKEV